jgi:hypothetical protein
LKLFFSFLFFSLFLCLCVHVGLCTCVRARILGVALFIGLFGFFSFLLSHCRLFAIVCVMCRSDFLYFSLHVSFFVDECFKFIFFLFVGLMWGFTFLVVAGMFVWFLCVLCWVDITLHFFLGDICHL